jgi:hypothetical protein
MRSSSSDIVRLLVQSEIEEFEYRDFASAFDAKLEEKLKEMDVANEGAAPAAPAPTVPANHRTPQKPERLEALPMRSRCRRMEGTRPVATPDMVDRPIDTLFQRLSKGNRADAEALPALFARLR